MLPYSMKDVDYDNAKFRHRSFSQVVNKAMIDTGIRRNCLGCTVGKFLLLLLIVGLAFLFLSTNASDRVFHGVSANVTEEGRSDDKFARFWRKPPQLPPRLSPDELRTLRSPVLDPDTLRVSSEWASKQERVREAFVHAWSGYKKYAFGFDELMPVSQRGVDGLGGLGATIVDSLDTALIMGVDDIAIEAGTWIEEHLRERIAQKGQVNLFETTIRVLGGLLSAYHLSMENRAAIRMPGHPPLFKGPEPQIYLKTAQDLADRLLYAFTSSPTPIPYSDVVLRDHSAHPAPDGLSSTAEVSTLQLEFSYLSEVSGEPKYKLEAMKVLEHFRKLPKTEGLVPIYISPHTGHFSGENIRLGSRGDSYYEYLLKVWLHQRENGSSNLNYLHEMYKEAVQGIRHLLVRKSVPRGLVFVGELPSGPKGSFSPKMDHLVCFLPGTLALGATKGLTKQKALEAKLLTSEDLKNLKLAEDLAKTCFEIYSVTSTGLAPEIVYFHLEGGNEGFDGGNKSSEYIHDIIIKPADRHNLLRPETVESLFVLYRITEDPKYRQWGWQIFEAFENHTKVESGGYCSLDDVTTVPPPRRDKMETFFLGETLKYLYLLFGDPNFLPLDQFVFNTEAHPFPVAGHSRH